MPRYLIASVLTLGTVCFGGLAHADSRADLLARYAAEAKAADPAFAGFDPARGSQLYQQKYTGGNPETPSCATCHTADPRKAGESRAGKPIDPMAVSVTPNRFQDAEKVEKWFGRECKSVIGRPCTPVEKGDFITYLLGL